MALNNREYKNQPLVHHSDRGLQYCSNEYQNLLEQHAIKPSMTEKYDPYENAVAERVNGILKQEFDVAKKVKLVEEAIYIYNDIRPHLSNYMLTPQQCTSKVKLK